jgi:DNA-binding SARP family transcriptional activator
MNPKASSALPDRPRLRVWLFGPFLAERKTQQGMWEPIPSEEWGRGTGSRRLLKRLLCAPGRRLTRGALLEDLWPDTADRNLTDAAHQLRHALREGQEEEPFLRSLTHPPAYALAPQSLLWTDAEAVHSLLHEAELLGRTSREALTFLEEAIGYLERGAFLEGEEGHWCYSLREDYEAIKHCCRLWLADTYQEQGRFWSAQRQLTLALENDPADEDALQRLLLLYQQAGLSRLAHRCYQSFRKRAEAEGRLLPSDIEQLASQPRRIVPPASQLHALSPFSSSASIQSASGPTTMSAMKVQGSGLRLCQGGGVLGDIQASCCSNENITQITRLFLEGESPLCAIPRRSLLQAVSTLLLGGISPSLRELLSQPDQERLEQGLSQAIIEGWRLFHAAKTEQAQGLAQAVLLLLQSNQELLSDQLMLQFYAGVCNLLGVCSYIHEQYQDARLAHQRAFLAALETGDPILVVQTHIAQANTLQALGRVSDAMQLLQRAEPLLEEIDDRSIQRARMRANLLASWADQAFLLQESALAQRKLDEAAEALGQLPPAEEFDHVSWLQLAGKHALERRETRHAADLLQRALSLLSPTSQLRQTFILLPLAVAYARLKERDACHQMLTRLVSILRTSRLPRIQRQAMLGGAVILEAFPEDHALQAEILALHAESAESGGVV